jgi:hypothetical protein
LFVFIDNRSRRNTLLHANGLPPSSRADLVDGVGGNNNDEADNVMTRQRQYDSSTTEFTKLQTFQNRQPAQPISINKLREQLQQHNMDTAALREQEEAKRIHEIFTHKTFPELVCFVCF